MNIFAAINFAADALAKAGVAEPRREASSLFAFVLQKNSTFLIAHPEYELSVDESSAFTSIIERRSRREPFHYITGGKEFYGLEFEVEPGVLIPRPETEILVEDAINILFEIGDARFYEIGVGSACISVSILNSVPDANAVGVDISDQAIAVAMRNARKHGVDGRLTLRNADLFDGTGEKFNLIVSNPPYIPVGDIAALQSEVRDFEPHLALAGGEDGLAVVKRIVESAPEFLKPQGQLLIEIGFGQATSVKELFDPHLWNDVEFLPDHQGIARIAKARSRN